jgi:hypothetical protein
LLLKKSPGEAPDEKELEMTQEEILQSPKFQMEAALIRKCSEDAEFRAKVLADPKGMLEEAFGRKLPENVSIYIHEENLTTLHFCVPPSRESLQEELTDEQLEQVAGGTGLVTVVTFLATASAITAIAGAATLIGSAAASAGYAALIQKSNW